MGDLKYYNLDLGTLSPKHREEASGILQLASQALHETNVSSEKPCLNYAHPQGCAFFREELAKFLSSLYGEKVNSGSLISTGGATQSLSLVVSHFLPPGCPVFAIEPCYLPAAIGLKDMFRDVIAVNVDKDGICVDQLESLLKDYEHRLLPKTKLRENVPFRAMVYFVTVFANPTGEVLTPERCRRLLQLAKQYDLLLISDDVYNALHLADENPPRLLSWCENEAERDHVISNGSFSKLLSPGVRLGWMETSRRNITIMNQWRYLYSGGPPNHYMCQLVAMALKKNLLQPHAESIRLHVKKNMEIAIRVLNDSLPEEASFRSPKGGFFLWIRLPDNVDGEKLATLLEQDYGILIRPGTQCSFTNQFRTHIRLTLSCCETSAVQCVIETLCDVIKKMSTCM